MQIIFLACDHNKNEFMDACSTMQITCQFISYHELGDRNNHLVFLKQILEASKNEKTIIVFSNSGMDKGVEEFCTTLLNHEVMAIPIGSEAILLGKSMVDGETVGIVNEYIIYGGKKNTDNCMKYICQMLGMVTEEIVAPPMKMPFDGIYTFENDMIYTSLEEHFAQKPSKFDTYVGILTHRSSWIKGDTAVEQAITTMLNSIGIGTICVYSYGKDESIKSKGFVEIVDTHFSINGNLMIRGLINFQMFLLNAHDGLSLSEAYIVEFLKLNIPIFAPVSSYNLTKKSWEDSINPLASSMGHTLLNSEMSGMIEPVLVGVSENGMHVPVKERVNYLCNRIQKYIGLGIKSNKDKKITLMLNNAVCSGVEATLGKAFALDAFESAVVIMNKLKSLGYEVEDIPKDGAALFERLLEKKAFSDFRWTSVEDIVASGGALYKMPCEQEYSNYYNELSDSVRAKMEEMWGKAPGEGMVIGDDLIISGLDFGNINLMIQPKRGCYGAKCTGEVCKILHDPLCPPPHQFLATYRFIEKVFQADAVIHVGTEGCLEYLPGKSNALSGDCLPSVVTGSLIHFYLYHAGVTSEALIAKRRANAVLIDYLPVSKYGIDDDIRSVIDTINEYLSAKDARNGQEHDLKSKLKEMLKETFHMEVDTDERFEECLVDLKSKAYAMTKMAKSGERHVFSKTPSEEECINFILEIWMADRIIPQDELDDFAYSEYVRDIITRLLHNEDIPQYQHLKEDVQYIHEKLQQTDLEMKSLIDGLTGKYIPAGESGMPDENGRKIIPTGRNMFALNIDKVPTKTAFERGKIMAEQLLAQYLEDEGRYPEKIAMNMISTDITVTKGEQLCQFLYLLGVKPVWDSLSRVVSLEVIPTQELKRPRIDVTVRISGVMRDTWGFAVDLMDEAVMLVAVLDESEEDNYIKRNIHQDEYSLTDRENTIRIFGDPPGTYGAGVDLALKASAWKEEKDLARYFVSYSAFAYGKGLSGKKSIREFIQNAKLVDITCDTTSTALITTMSDSFGTEVQGGYRLIAKTIGGKTPRQYQINNQIGQKVSTQSLKAQVKEEMDATLLNPFWKENIMKDSYDGASELMHRIQSVFEIQCLNDCVDDATLDALTNAYVNDDRVREWLLEHNKYSAEEIARRLLELKERGKWNGDEEVLQLLKMNYLQIEGDMESGLSGLGEIQAGSIDIIDDSQVEQWNNNMKVIDEFLK